MKLGVFTPILQAMTLDAALTYLQPLGVQMVELGCGGYPGRHHCDPDILLHDEAALSRLRDTIARHGMEISALSCHGNAVHPDKAVAHAMQRDFENTILMAEKLGVHQINTFSGCPGDHPGAKYPNWVTCPWPEDFLAILKYQWEDVLIPYWVKAAVFAREHGVDKIALEMHPGFCVYSASTLLKLRAAVGPAIGANFDPSHLYWQGVDIVAAIRELSGAIYHFHAKDTSVDPINTGKNGVLDTTPYADEIHRSWIFRSVGYGHDYQEWKAIISALRMVGYDYAVSIEHEDSLMSPREGLEKAIRFLQDVLINEPKGEMTWA